MESIVLPLASRGSRIANSIIDSTMIFLLWIIITAGFIMFGFDQTILDPKTGDRFPIVALPIFIPIFFLYYFILESEYQQTIGKYLTKTKVVSKDGDKPTTSKVALRTICRLIPFEGYSFLATPNGIHDSLSGTRVVKWYA